ncbi:hypothetical protein BDL97_14G000600 [Sphagnum fallax]|nr:hypothetical protein BDL97_14G000600 [Sphagnum fallax]KAH8940736.1 hypothetical protein BDL97_14G000600 [Sphagnum fallax]
MAAFLPAPTISVPIAQPRTKIMVLHCSPNHSLSLKTLFPRLDTRTLGTKKLANCFKPCSVCAQACASSLSATASQSHKDKGLWQVVGTIGAATAISKFMGLLRETVLAAVFGVGPVINAFNYASIIPGFSLAMLGGINGPFHSAMTAALSKRSKEDRQQLVESVSTIAGLVCAGMSIVVYTMAAPLLDTFAPGLVWDAADGVLTRQIAIVQLKVMAPCVMLAALIGISFGSLSADGIYGVPSLSPALSSMAILVAVAQHVLWFGSSASASENFMAGGIVLAVGSTLGAVLQWLAQVVAKNKAGSRLLHLHWVNPFQDEGVREVMAVMMPAAVGSGMLQIATFTDLYFASFIPGAAAALGYANLLVMAPLGILSSSILLPLLPIFSRLSQAVTLSMVSVMTPLARPIVRVLFERRAFGAPASGLVSSLVICYVLGSTFYLARDVLVRVFYALGDGQTPFYISLAAIVANAALDWLLVRFGGFGAPGLVLATMVVNIASAGALLTELSGRLGGLQLSWERPVLLLVGCSLYSSAITRVSYDQIFVLLSRWTSHWIVDFTSLSLASTAGVMSFFAPLVFVQVPEIRSVLQLALSRFDSEVIQ